MASDPRSDAAPATAPRPAPGARFATPRRLHPASILVGLDAGRLLQAGVIPLLALLGEGGRLLLFGVVALLVAGFAGRVLDWYRRTYAFDGSELRVESGILGRSLRTLDVARIQQIEIRKGLLQRLLGLAVVRVETAGSASEPEVELRVVVEEEAVALRRAVRAAKRSRALLEPEAGDPDAPSEDPSVARSEHVLSVSPARIILASVTGARLLVLPAFLAAATQFAEELSDRFWDRAVARLDGLGQAASPLVSDATRWAWVTAIVLGVTLLAAAAAAIAGLVRDGGFRIDRVDGDLQVSRGLLGTRESLIPLGRVQLVAIRSNWIRRLLGFASVEVRSAGGSAGRGGSVTIPLLSTAEAERFIGEILPGVDRLPPMRRHPRAALRRTLVRRTTRAALLAAIIAVGFYRTGWLAPWAAVPLAGLVLLGVARGVAEYRALAHAMSGSVIVSRHGGLSLTTEIGPLAKVQAVGARSGPLQRRLDLGSLDVHVAGPRARLTIRDAERARLTELRAELTAQAARAG